LSALNMIIHAYGLAVRVRFMKVSRSVPLHFTIFLSSKL
jgi:hypothetical protein